MSNPAIGIPVMLGFAVVLPWIFTGIEWCWRRLRGRR